MTVTYEHMTSISALEAARKRLMSEIPLRETAMRAKLARIDVALLSRKLQTGEYQHRKCNAHFRNVEGKQRFIDSPALVDKLVQRAYVDTLTPRMEELSSDSSHGYRPNRSIHTGLWHLIQSIEKGNLAQVFRTDIEGFFDNVRHDDMAACLGGSISDPELLKFSLDLLRTAYSFRNEEKGLPTGWLINPIWANLLLSPTDHALDRQGISFIRYADDYGAVHASQGEAKRTKAILTERLSELSLTLKDGDSGKTYIADLRSGKTVLGHEVKLTEQGITIIASRSSMEKLEKKLLGLIAQLGKTHDPQACIKEIRDIATGWSNTETYYPDNLLHPRFAEIDSLNKRLSKRLLSVIKQANIPLAKREYLSQVKRKGMIWIRPLSQMRLVAKVAA